MPKAPIPTLSTFKHPRTVKNASLIAPPTIGTQLSMVSFKVFAPKLSAELLTRFCNVKTPTNSDEIVFKKDFIIFSTSSQKPLRLILEDIEEIKDTPSRVFKIGTSQLTDTYETIWPAVTTNIWYEVADMVCPDAIITPEITGTIARVNFAAL